MSNFTIGGTLIKDRKMKRQVDMLNGPLLGKILMFALPIAASSILQQLFNSVDVAVVGRFSSPQALAAVGSNGSLINLMINLFVGISIGANVVISRFVGKRDEEGIKRAVSTSIAVSLVSGLFLLLFGLITARTILEAMDTPSDVIELSVLYLRVYFLGMPFVMLFNFTSSIFRSVGDTRRPLYCLAAGGVVNVIVNLILVVVFHLDVLGVAVGTVVGNAVAAALVLRLLQKEAEPFRLQWSAVGFSRKELAQMLSIGVPAGVQSMVFSFANVFIQTAINGYGALAVAGSAAALNYEHYCYFVIAAFGSAATTFTGQNYGAKNGARCRVVFRHALWMSVVGCGLLNLLFVWQERWAIGLFSSDAEIFEFAFVRLETVLLWQWIACSYEIASASLRGVGYSLLPALLTIFGTCVLRLCWVFLYCPSHPGFQTLMVVYPISWILIGVMVLSAHYIVFKKKLSWQFAE